jgi:hypothetical protein
MKLTKSTLQQLIREELNNVLNEKDDSTPPRPGGPEIGPKDPKDRPMDPKVGTGGTDSKKKAHWRKIRRARLAREKIAKEKAAKEKATNHKT